jgi:hypothetical protein
MGSTRNMDKTSAPDLERGSRRLARDANLGEISDIFTIFSGQLLSNLLEQH